MHLTLWYRSVSDGIKDIMNDRRRPRRIKEQQR